MSPTDFQTLALAWMGVAIVLVPAVFLVFRSVIAQVQQLTVLLHANGEKVNTVQETLTNGTLGAAIKAAVKEGMHENTLSGSVAARPPSSLDSRVSGHASDSH